MKGIAFGAEMAQAIFWVWVYEFEKLESRK